MTIAVFFEGCGSGTTEAHYEEYGWQSKDILLRFYYDRPSRNGTSNFYWSLAAGRRYVEKNYLIYGTYRDQYPSNKMEEGWDWALSLDFGWRIGAGKRKTITNLN